MPKLETELFGFKEPIFSVRDGSRTVWVANGMIYAMGWIVMCMRSGSAEKYGFTE